MNHYQQLLKQFNTRKQKPRYKAKRERRNYLTEAFIDGELALYKPAHVPYKVYNDASPVEIKKSVMRAGVLVSEKVAEAFDKYSGITEGEFDTTSTEGAGGFDVTVDKDSITFSPHIEEKIEASPTKLTWFEKLLLWIRKIFKK
jgi:hypothetical protein